MSDLRTAAQQALEFLDAEFGWSPGEAPRIDALRAALKQEEEASAWLAERKEHWRKEREKAQQVKTCAWRDNLDAIYETECGNLHIVNDGTLEENGMKYCCYCGKEIEDESPT